MMLGWRENNAARRGGNMMLDEKQQRSVLFIIPASYERHFQLVADLILGIKTNYLRVLQSRPCELCDCRGHGGGKQQRLATGMSHFFQDVADLGEVGWGDENGNMVWIYAVMLRVK
jgi:hypothetical protein